MFDPDGDGSKFIAALAPRAGETVLIKSLPNAFAATDLAARIRDMGRREVVIAGFATHMCVSATARSALDHGLRNTVVAAATATRDLPHAIGAGITPAECIQQATPRSALRQIFDCCSGYWCAFPQCAAARRGMRVP